MKHVKLVILTLLLVVGFNKMNAQDNNNNIAIGIGINAVDFYPTNASGMVTPNGNSTGWYDEFFNGSDHYNTLPAISRITVSKYLADGFSFEAAGTLNKVTKVGDKKVSSMAYYGLDGAVKYDLNTIVGETGIFDPYVLVGGGYTWLGSSYGTGTFNGGVGFNLWFNDTFGINVESKYKHSFESLIVQHFQHGLGLMIKFGGTDTDKDGVFDKDDACPDVFGLAEFKGCPDSDNDGVVDSEDACPNVAGTVEFKGCPDTDGDGIADKDDACPTEKGTKANNGCPDTDGDGIADKDDACPTEKGTKANNGCPDTDGDGIIDKEDVCPTEAGTKANKGCPEVSKVELNKLDELFKTVYFDTGKASFKKETLAKLDEASTIITKYTSAKFSIEGYTDSIGGPQLNLELSERRANAVKDYLISKGVLAKNLNAKGFGEENPIATNMNAAGRSQNRRVVIKLIEQQ